jgi:hypothetical protein
MGFVLIRFIQGWLVSLCLGAKQHLRQWARPANVSLPVGTALDLTRSKSELALENALLRQQLIVLQRQVKRPALTWRDRTLLVLIASKPVVAARYPLCHLIGRSVQSTVCPIRRSLIIGLPRFSKCGNRRETFTSTAHQCVMDGLCCPDDIVSHGETSVKQDFKSSDVTTQP